MTEEVPSKKGNARANREDKARKVVERLAVKLHKFQPSGISVWTVVGSDRDFLVDFQTPKPYCSCSDFYYRVLSGRVPECYHLLAVKTAAANELYSVVEFSDEEFPGFMKALVSDIFGKPD